MSRAIRLGTVATLVVGVVGALGVVASIALVETTSVLHRSSQQMLVAAESINAAQELEANVLLHSRESLLWELSKDPIHRERRDAARIGLKSWFVQIRKYVEDPLEARMVSDAERVVDQYLQEREQLEAAGLSSEEIARRLADPTAAALSRLEALTTRNVEEAKADHEAATALDRRADLLGMAVVSMILLMIPAILILLDRLVFRPLKEMDKSLKDFGAGKDIVPIESGVVEVRAVSATLAQMARQIQRQRETQVRYLAAVAHDLRNPIGAIKMSAEILTQENRGGDNLGALGRETRAFLDVIHRQSAYLNRMVGDLLETAKVEAGQIELKPAPQDLKACVRDCVELFRHYSEAHRLRFDAPDCEVRCTFDALRVSQVINNLISNAIKYSPFGGEVLVHVEQRGGEVVVAVTDHGAGISAEDLDPIFEPFRRSKATQETIPGVGLGLFTARKLVQAHGGRIVVASQLGTGSTFSVHLPAGDVDGFKASTPTPRADVVTTTAQLH